MLPVALSDVIAVGEVPTAAEIEILAKAGFQSLLNTQPDGEVQRLMPSSEAAALAAKVGLTYRHVPIESRRPTDASVVAFAASLADLPRPIYACCYSGARAAAVWALAAADKTKPDDIIVACSRAGYDISFMKAELQARHAGKLANSAVPSGLSAAPTANGHTKDGGNASNAEHANAATIPSLVPSGLMPRAASAGGFAVPG
jgi:sulfide:quinone oxidoreductase